ASGPPGIRCIVAKRRAEIASRSNGAAAIRVIRRRTEAGPRLGTVGDEIRVAHALGYGNGRERSPGGAGEAQRRRHEQKLVDLVSGELLQVGVLDEVHAEIAQRGRV